MMFRGFKSFLNWAPMVLGVPSLLDSCTPDRYKKMFIFFDMPKKSILQKLSIQTVVIAM